MPYIDLEALWDHHSHEFRDPREIVGGISHGGDVPRDLLEYELRGDFFGLLQQLGVSLLVTREYEHLVIALSVLGGSPLISYLRLPHPSGIAFDASTCTVAVASTRNPNQIHFFRPVSRTLHRTDIPLDDLGGMRPLMPSCVYSYPGSLYLHDLAFVGGELHGNAVGQNAVVRLDSHGQLRVVWWPRSVERDGKPVISTNYLQLNSIAAGSTLEESYFTASTDRIGELRPGHPDFPVDKRGVVFDGRTREVFGRGLTRPHSARLIQGQVWVDNSGYGQVGYIESGVFREFISLPGWTRGLADYKSHIVVATSRVIPKFACYAPGLDPSRCVCGVHVIEKTSGKVAASLVWPKGNQVFAVECLPATATTGFPFIFEEGGCSLGKVPCLDVTALFYTFKHEDMG